MEDVKMFGTSDGDGVLSLESERSAHGLLYKVEWMGAKFEDGVSVSITAEDFASGEKCALLVSDEGMAANLQYYPRTKIHEVNGDEEDAYTEIHFAGSLYLDITGGGASNEGGCVIYYIDQD
jgi:hypothetical protein